MEVIEHGLTNEDLFYARYHENFEYRKTFFSIDDAVEHFVDLRLDRIGKYNNPIEVELSDTDFLDEEYYVAELSPLEERDYQFLIRHNHWCELHNYHPMMMRKDIYQETHPINVEDYDTLKDYNNYHVLVHKEDFHIKIYDKNRKEGYTPFFARCVGKKERLVIKIEEEEILNGVIFISDQKQIIEYEYASDLWNYCVKRIVMSKKEREINHRHIYEFIAFDDGSILNLQGYNQFRLSADGYKKVYSKSLKKDVGVHRLVARAFVGNRDVDEYNVVNHIDGDKLNNSFHNLEWCTTAQNLKHAWETGLNPLNTNPNKDYKIFD